jgi:hypothetical protein
MKFKLPKIKAVHPKLIASDLISVQPMSAPKASMFFFNYKYKISDVIAGATYFAKASPGPGGTKIWMLCAVKDIYSPEYEPYFAITTGHSYAIYDVNGQPIVCTDREIFKRYELNIEDVRVLKEEEFLVDNRDFLELEHEDHHSFLPGKWKQKH